MLLILLLAETKLHFVQGKLHERLHRLSALLTISAPVLRQRVSTLTCTTVVNHINILEAKITSCVFGVPWKRSKHSKYMLTLNLPRITNYGRQVYLLPSCENELNLFYESMRTIESINDFKRARKNYLLVVYSLNYVL